MPCLRPRPPHVDHDLGRMEVHCRHCDARRWQSENAAICCMNGSVTLPPLPPVPHILRKLFTGTDQAATKFRDNIRSYNNALAFASLGAKEDILPPGIYCFRLNGQTHHRIGHLHPDSAEKPKFAQIYIFDTKNELENRLNWNDHLDRDLLQKLQDFLHIVNPFVKIYKHASEALSAAGDQANEVKMVLKADSTKDARRYNLPQASEVAVILPNMPLEAKSRDIVLYRRAADDPTGFSTKRISELHPQYDPLHYVLLFPFGHEGWRDHIQHNGKGGKVSIMEFYAYRLMIREEPNIILYGGRLFQQFVVDQYSKMEGERLSYLRRNQNILRAELYQGLHDAVSAGDTEGARVGMKIVLPATFIGSPRSMIQLYQDAMGIVRKYGKPDLFITFTCNPSWPEITRELYPGQVSADRPDLASRVFKLKLCELMNDIMKKEIFGKVLAHVRVVEFQKRGLPHAHILIILHQDSKPRSAEDVDKIVCAEFSNNLDLQPLVEKHMIHGPCGEGFNSPCMKDSVCSKRFPKEFSPATELTDSTYPRYKRRNNGLTVKKKGAVLDNRWVVPYNPFLLRKYHAHINIEVCSSITAVKYLYKYVYKGHDRVMVEFQNNCQPDEIIRYLDARYVSASEACWRLFHFEIQSRSPPITRLAVHLPDQQSIVYREGQAQEALQKQKDTTLMAWFKANQHYEQARQLLYLEMPEEFRWDISAKSWAPRKNKVFSIGRLYNVSPAEGERFYLRLLLLHRKGVTSFEDLRTVGDILCATFREACHHLGLLQSDDEWKLCLEEAVATSSPHQLRHLFTTILIFCEPSEPATLWELFKPYMSEDFVFQQNTAMAAENMALSHLQTLLHAHKKELCDFGLPESNIQVRGNAKEDKWNMNEERQKAADRSSQLNNDQRIAFEKIKNTVSNGQNEVNKLFFVDGPGGCGKTFLYNTILSYFRGCGSGTIAVASSGIAAELLEGGRTAHSTFKIPIPIEDNSTCRIGRQSDIARRIRNTDIIVWDEAPMMDRRVFEAVSRSLCDIQGDSRPFGGKVVVLGGDFRQILPVVVRGEEADIVNAALNRSVLWDHVTVLHLTQNMRAQDDTGGQFQQWLQRIGNGTEVFHKKVGPSAVKLPTDMCLPPNNIQALIDAVFPNIKDMSDDNTYYAERAILTTTNNHVDLINDTISRHLEGPGVTTKSYFSADSLRDSDPAAQLLYPPEFLNSLNITGLPPHKLTLSVHTPIMLLRNLNPKAGLLNGTRLKIIHLGDHVIEAKFLTGVRRNQTTFIPRIMMSPSDTELPFSLLRRQFPLRPCYAMTINKAQGQTLPFVGVYLPSSVFTHGQLYVALSRARSFHGIKVSLQDRKDEEPVYTDNIVYQSVMNAT